MKIINCHDFKNKDARENAFDTFHSEIGDKIGLTKEEVYYVRKLANANNILQIDDVLSVLKYSLKCKKRNITKINKEIVRSGSSEEYRFKKIALNQSISNIEEKIAWREHLLAKIERMQEAAWTFLLQGITLFCQMRSNRHRERNNR